MKKGNIKAITLMNALLCFCVVAVHLTSWPLAELNNDSLWYILLFSLNKLLHFSVPAFIFLSGFKLFNKYSDVKIDCRRFFSGRFKKIIVPYVISVLIYFVYFYSKAWVSLKELPQYVFLGTLSAQFYYVIIALQFYLLFPVLKGIFKRSPVLVTVLSFICTLCCQQYLHFTYSDRFFASYLFYFVFGMLVSAHREKIKKAVSPCIAICIISGFIHARFSYFSTIGKLFYRHAYVINVIYVTSAIIALYGICTYLCKKCDGIYRLSAVLSAVSYDVYLYHVLPIAVLQYDIFPRLSLTPGWQFAVSSAVVLSLIAAYALIKNISRSKNA
ncbi:MAG: acyltransferase [Clostridia bacterium]|nr:acyltransferase [Clostridia bacterium]